MATVPSLLDTEYREIVEAQRMALDRALGDYGRKTRYVPSVGVSDPDPDVVEGASERGPSDWRSFPRRRKYSGSDFPAETNTIGYRRESDDDRQFEADVRRLWDTGRFTMDALADHFGETIETIADVLTARQRAGVYNDPATNRPGIEGEDLIAPNAPRETPRTRLRERMKARRRSEGKRLGW